MTRSRIRIDGSRLQANVEINDEDTPTSSTPAVSEYEWSLGIDVNADGTINGGKVQITESRARLEHGVASVDISGGVVTITPAPAPAAHTHDGDTLQLDGVNSNGGAFTFTTSGDITFNAKKLSGVADPAAAQDAATKNSSETYADGKVSDANYPAGWDGTGDVAPSKNQVFDLAGLLVAYVDGQDHDHATPIATHAADDDAHHAVFEPPGDHTSQLPVRVIPDDGWTAGTSNTYWYPGYGGDNIRHGITSNANGFVRGSFRVPQNYKAGTDLLLKFLAWAATSVAQIDSVIYASSHTDGDTRGWVENGSTNKLAPTALGVGTQLYRLTFTLANATHSFVVGDHVSFAYSLDDNEANDIIESFGWSIEYTADEYE